MNWLQSIFDASDFMPRSMCGTGWTEGLLLINQSANLIVWLAYTLIPLAIFRFWWRKRGQYPKLWLLLLFVAFIWLCGLTHANDWLVFHWPAYRFFTATDVATALVSLPTAVATFIVLEYVASLPSKKDYETVTTRLLIALQEVQALKDSK